MLKEPSVSIKRSTLMTLAIRVLLFLALAILSACVNIRTVKIPQEYNNAESKIVIVPIESPGLYVAPTGWGMLFGAAGVVVEHAATASKREALAQNIKETWGDWRPEVVFRDKLAEELTKRGRTVIQESEIVLLPENIRDSSQAAPKWYNPDVTVFDHSTIMNRYNPTAIMEVGFEEPTIIGHRVIIAALIKVVDPRTKNLIARRRLVKNMSTGKYNPKDPVHRQQYIADFKTAFENEMAKAASKMLDDIGL
jgi:hypothetical protein